LISKQKHNPELIREVLDLLLLFGLFPLVLGLGLILIYLFMQEGSQSNEDTAEEKK